MKTYRLDIIFLSLLIILSVCSCEKEISLDVDDVKKCLVMSAYMNPDEPFSVCVTESIPFSEPYNNDCVEVASVSVFSDGVLLEKLVFNDSKKRYIGSLSPIIGNTYSVVVHDDSYTDLSATTSLPLRPTITNIQVSSADDVKLSFSIHDVESDKNNFFRLLVVETWPSGAIKYPAIQSVDQMLRNKGEGDAAFSIDSDPKNLYSIFSDKMFAGEEYNITLSFRHTDYTTIKPSVKLVVQSITEDYFLFLKTHAAQRTTDYIPFSEPVDLYSNVEGGLGVLASFCDSQLPVL